MKPGFMGMILKLNFSHHSGRVLILWGLRRHVSLGPRWKWCWLYFSILVGQTVNQHVYKEVLIHLRDAIRRKRPEFWSSCDYYLCHNNAPAHMALKFCNYLANKKVSVIFQPPYSPDLAPCDFYLFLKLKIVMKGQCYDDVDAIKQKPPISSDASDEKASKSECRHG